MTRTLTLLAVLVSLGIPAGALAKPFATKPSRCEKITVTTVASNEGSAGQGQAFVEELVNEDPAPSLQLFMDRETGTLRAAKVVRPASGGSVSVTSIPVAVVVEYEGCRPESTGRAITVEYYDAKDFLP